MKTMRLKSYLTHFNLIGLGYKSCGYPNPKPYLIPELSQI